MAEPGFDEDVIDAKAALAAGMLRFDEWSSAKTGEHVIYPQAVPGRRSAEIVSIEVDKEPRPFKTRTGNDKPVFCLTVTLRRADGQLATYVAAPAEMVYLSATNEDGAWPTCKRTYQLWRKLSPEEIERAKKDVAAEKRRKKKKQKYDDDEKRGKKK